MMGALRKIGIGLGILIAAVVALLILAPLLTRPISEEKLRALGVIEADSLFVEVDGVRTRYVASGEGGKSIVFLHGFSSSLYSWRRVLKPISKAYRVYALDLKGFGFTEKPESDYTTDEYVDFVVDFMDAVGLDKATLCGNSMGGGIAWRAALKYPERVEKLILVDSAGYPSSRNGLPFIMKLGRVRGIEKLFALLATRGQIRSSLRSAYFNDRQVTERTVDAYYYPMRTEGAMWAVLARIRNPRSDAEQWRARIPELDLPGLIIWGANDTWISARDAVQFHKDMPNSSLLIFPECGHLPQEETPAGFVVAVLDFMSSSTRELLLTETAPTEPAGIQPVATST